MQTIQLKSWSEFPGALADIRGKYGRRTVDAPGGGTLSVPNDIVYRGQADGAWQLETTLERTTGNASYPVLDYFVRTNTVVNEIESLTGKQWNLPTFPDFSAKLSMSPHIIHSMGEIYEFLVYLRHHGFPSPLMDWTRSPFIAAFFAMEQQSSAENAAIFAFIETPEGAKAYSVGEPAITGLGPYVTTHPRHFIQKASYTISTKYVTETKSHSFCQHQYSSDAFANHQDVLIKILVPRSERATVLRNLEEYNINHYTLFQTQDAMIRSLGLRAFELM